MEECIHDMDNVVELRRLEALSQPELAEQYNIAENNCEQAIIAMRGIIDELASRRPHGEAS